MASDTPAASTIDPPPTADAFGVPPPADAPTTTPPSPAATLALIIARAVQTALQTTPVTIKGGDLPEALDAEEAAALCGVSRSHWLALDRKGLTPAAVLVGESSRRWGRRELVAWIAEGTPARRTWQAQREAAMRRAG